MTAEIQAARSATVPVSPLPNREIVILALHLLGGATRTVHTEDIALKCFEIAPDSFSWTKYTQYPDKDIVRVALTDARKEKYGALVDGRSGQKRGQFQRTQRDPVTDGWTLTSAGVHWVEQNAERFRPLGVTEATKEHRQKTLQFLSRVKRHRVFKLYEDSPNRFFPTIGDLADLVRCRVDAEDGVWRDRFERIKKHAVALGNEHVIDFIQKSIRAYEEQR